MGLVNDETRMERSAWNITWFSYVVGRSVYVDTVMQHCRPGSTGFQPPKAYRNEAIRRMIDVLLFVQRPTPMLRDEYQVIFSVPHRVAQTYKLIHLVSFFPVHGGSRLEVFSTGNPE